MRSVFLEHPSSYAHHTGRHPEQPGRLSAIEDELARRDWLGFERIHSPAVDRSVLTAVHSESYVAWVQQRVADGAEHLDWDTVISSGSFDAALHAAGGAVRMVELLLEGEARFGFSAHRPPGHHATADQAMGFCLFNNVAVAATFAIEHRGVERVMILDWDVHHGNGTNDIFHSTPQVLFVSIHQSPLYPGTGPAEDVGSGPGHGFTVNLPVAPGSDDAVFTSLVAEVAVPLARSFKPQLVLVSAGFDAHREDPLGECLLTEQGFASMATWMRGVCQELNVPLGCVLEGGYALGALGRSVAATMEALSEGPAQADSGGGDEVPEVTQARERLRRWWPELAR